MSQRFFAKRFLPLLVVVLFVMPVVSLPALAFDTRACHCFRQRSFDPKQPFAADDYILTTSFNSLTAAWFGISKKQLVVYKMKGGVKADDLLLALALNKECRLDLDKLLAARQKAGSWRKAVAGLPQPRNVAADKTPTLVRIREGASPALIARAVADRMLAGFYQVPAARIAALRRAGLGEKEMALVLILEKEKGIPAAKLIEQVKQQGRSWSEVAFYLGVTPKAAGRMILAGRGGK